VTEAVAGRSVRVAHQVVKLPSSSVPSHPPRSFHRPVAVTLGSLTENLNKTGVRLGTDCAPQAASCWAPPFVVREPQQTIRQKRKPRVLDLGLGSRTGTGDLRARASRSLPMLRR
jgi:hypothetical protein